MIIVLIKLIMILITLWSPFVILVIINMIQSLINK